jgi:AcrR family transcriptional regulator
MWDGMERPDELVRPRRRSQSERRAATQAALLDATIECLVEFGYRHTTTTRVAERAGVSRGAQVHHFHTKADLVAAAVARLAMRREEQLREAAKRLPPGPARLEAALDLLWETYNNPLFEATVELWVVARTDPELRASLAGLEREVIAMAYESAGALLGEYTDVPGFDQKLALVLSSIQGTVLLRSVFSGDRNDPLPSWRRRRAELVGMFEPAAPAAALV